ncbi:hypothetical protein QBZ16_003229 [Prototheca wickerhamii]|uniref:Cyclin C-terminal domain-containing protein n=1 Tax=Prototheca wickerhamii TaxID=3111 RepID=A0AAD9MHD3_PROWI|nr:hypothetical protein QBZ16_003229 [Prototheca wickerhamii]
MSGARERLFLAERAVLYATRFDFVVEHPVTLLLQALQQPPLPSVLAMWEKEHPTAPRFQQLCFDLVNDSYKTPLCLMFPASHIALACIWTVMKLLRLDTRLLDTNIAQILLREVYGRAIQGDGQLESPPSAPGQPPTTKSNGAEEPAEYEELFEEFLSPE